MPRFHYASFLLVALLAACEVDERAPADARADSRPDAAADSGRDVAPDSSLAVLDGTAAFAPVDEGTADPSFDRFRGELLRAVERRDTTALMAVVASDIRNTFGDDNGQQAFRRMWRIDRADSELWSTLERVLRNGGAFRVAGDDSLFMAPYVYAAWPDDFDAFQHVATLRADAIVRDAPDSAATALGVLPHRIVAIGWPPTRSASEAWTEIVLSDGRRGWVANEDVYSPVGYRAIFARRDGAWRMITLIAGD
jgi:hypothetical protein